MPKLSIRRKTTTKKDKPDPLKEAEAAVTAYEDARDELIKMQEDFEAEHSEAFMMLESIKHQEDAVQDLIAKAKAKVAAVGESVGEFGCTQPYSQPGYDEKKLTDIFRKMKNPGPLLEALMVAGVIKEIKIDKSAGNAFAASNPKTASPLKKAWVERIALTPRVTVPKL